MNYRVGDKVMLDIRVVQPEECKKFVPKYRGPFRVVKTHNNGTVDIQQEHSDNVQLVHVNRLKPIFETMIWADENWPDAIINNAQANLQTNKENDLPTPPTANIENENQRTNIDPPESEDDISTTPSAINDDPPVPTLPDSIQPPSRQRPGLRSQSLIRPSSRYPPQDYLIFN